MGADEVTQVLVPVPSGLHAEFKAQTAMERTTMREKIINLIEESVKRGRRRQDRPT